LIGYFPTYSLGSFLSVQLFDTMKKKHPAFANNIETGDFGPIRAWLSSEIHQYGQSYTSGEVANRVTGMPLSSEPFLQYVKAKFEL
jgi:carboxypeptidase Taq